ncbi:MAG TPA: hypothetical protein VIX63_16330, partial [Vicinamibacterales bacterium]
MNRLQHAGAAGSSDRPHAEWLDDHLEVRGHRQGYEARSFPDLFAARLPRVSRGATLDLFCGTGRHVMFSSDRQPVAGLDLSPWLPDAARTSLP